MKPDDRGQEGVALHSAKGKGSGMPELNKLGARLYPGEGSSRSERQSARREGFLGKASVRGSGKWIITVNIQEDDERDYALTKGMINRQSEKDVVGEIAGVKASGSGEVCPSVSPPPTASTS